MQKNHFGHLDRFCLIALCAGAIVLAVGCGDSESSDSAPAIETGGASSGCAVVARAEDRAVCLANSGGPRPVLTVKVGTTPTGPNQPILKLSAAQSSVTAYITAIGTEDFTPKRISAQFYASPLNSRRAAAIPTSASSNSTVVAVQLSSAGVYEVLVSAENSRGVSISRTAWIQVWEDKTTSDTMNIGMNPGVEPPSAVALLSADLGPFVHPRLFFNAAEWARLNSKVAVTTSVPVARESYLRLISTVQNGIDKPGTELNRVASLLAAYIDGGYSPLVYNQLRAALAPANGPMSSLLQSSVLGSRPTTSLSDSIAAAAYIAWLQTDPSIQNNTSASANRLRYIGRLGSALSVFLIRHQMEVMPSYSSGPANSGLYSIPPNGSLAFVYDLVYTASGSAERTAMRNYLYSIGNIYNNGTGGVSRSRPGTTARPATTQNGVDFPNLADNMVLPALVIEGEESVLSPNVAEFAAFGNRVAASESTVSAIRQAAWSNASESTVWNLWRQVRANSEFQLTPWGLYANMYGYFGFGQHTSSPGTLALARRGENQWVTSNLYQSSLNPFFYFAPTQPTSATLGLIDPHDAAGFSGSGDRTVQVLGKYMYPTDPLTDFVFRQATTNYSRNDLIQALFSEETFSHSQETVAQLKGIPTNKFDPVLGLGFSRNGWKGDDLALHFNNFTLGGGHYHAEANSFALTALGRVWANPPGYHIVPGDSQQQVLIQLDSSATDASEGFVGQGPSSYNTTRYVDPVTRQGSAGTPFPGRVVRYEHDPAGKWSWYVGDSKPAYDYVRGSPGTSAGPFSSVETGLTAETMVLPAVLQALPEEERLRIKNLSSFRTGVLTNRVRYAYRGILVVKGENPYVLVHDAIDKDGSPKNYRWSLNSSVGYGLSVEPGASSRESVLMHAMDAGTAVGLPRLLLRDLSPHALGQHPVIGVDDRPLGGTKPNLTYGFDNNSGKFSFYASRRLFVSRNSVVDPGFLILLFPFRTGAALPVSSWDATTNTLVVRYQGVTDRIQLELGSAGGPPRLVAFSRS